MSRNEDLNAASSYSTEQSTPESALYVVRRLRGAFLSICRCGDVLFSPYRLTMDQYALMRAVQRTPGIRQTDIASQILADSNTVTAMVKLLEKRGILRRKASPEDGRVRQLSLTTHGQSVMQRLTADWIPMRMLLRECFAGEEGRKALQILDNVFQRMQGERENLLRASNPESTKKPKRATKKAASARTETGNEPVAYAPRAKLRMSRLKPARSALVRV